MQLLQLPIIMMSSRKRVANELEIMDLDPILAALEETDKTNEGDGVMQRNLKEVLERLRFELTRRSNTN